MLRGAGLPREGGGQGVGCRRVGVTSRAAVLWKSFSTAQVESRRAQWAKLYLDMHTSY